MNILSIFRGVLIKRMRKAYFGDQLINDVLKALKLRQTGLPDFKHIPPPPQLNKIDTPVS